MEWPRDIEYNVYLLHFLSLFSVQFLAPFNDLMTGTLFLQTIVKYKTHLFYILSAMEIFFIFILADVCVDKSLPMVSVLFDGWTVFVLINIIVLLRWTTR